MSNESDEPKSVDPPPSYAVGRGKPPEATKFKKGQPRKSRARTKTAAEFSKFIKDALNQKITIQIDGSEQKISMLDAGALQVVKKLAQGDTESLAFVRKFLAREDAKGPEKKPAIIWYDEADLDL